MTIRFEDPNRPNSYIGRTVPRPNAGRLVKGRGRYVDDILLPRMVHVAFVRSPYAHARIAAIETSQAKSLSGVLAVFTGRDLAEVCTPWEGRLAHLEGMKTPPQHPLAVERACWVGEPVVAVVGRTRADAEEGAAMVEIEFEALPAVTDIRTALDPETPVIHEAFGDNLCFRKTNEKGEVDRIFAEAHTVVEESFKTARHTGVTLEPRVILADWSEAEGEMTVHVSNQAPHMLQVLLASHLGIPESGVRVICGDVGGSFGVKVHVYPDEVATAAIAKILGRPVKFSSDRLEAFTSDIHARDHEATGRIALDETGRILAFDVDDWTGIGPYSIYPRTSAVEGLQVTNLIGGPYEFDHYRCRTSVVFQNKGICAQYRAVGHPVAVAITEGLVDKAAAQMGLDPVEIRRRNLIRDDAYPRTTAAGLKLEALSHHKSLDALIEAMDYEALRSEQASLREKGVHRGIGIASFIELTNPSPFMYGIGGARISAQDGCTVRMDPDGSVVALTGVTEQGQGTEAITAQIVAEAVGVSPGMVRIVTGDTRVTPFGGGTWASRGAGIGGEAALQAGRAVRGQVLAVAAAMLQANAKDLDIRDGIVVDAGTGAERMPLAEIGRIVYFRGDTLPKGLPRELMQTRHFLTSDYPYAFTNGVQASYVEVDAETGFVKLLKHWCVEDCGRIINPLLVDEQIRGGIVQGLGAALFEEICYDEAGQLLNGTMADYLVPMSGEMPDMIIRHVETPTAESELGAKGAGEAGTAGAPAAVMNAINDAIRPLGGSVTHMPFTPERVLRAIGAIGK
ncbi:xanthine dehydrogenase family protein molybdopterin-binding subunit [Fulvimarina endophytica]|uniref:Xanthine dehydrogenase family protein molybdopterin-binding subunit n=1 Tax=Fulvimarina endophytica TaxID=2293836 RepID=A0A371X3C5_9HYPH|nr:xanthine dehydrogenase family protein molybdopterin-binding subunit [Fulvimarina endophytica]RFC63534.1 xanthine dehydrogenase family protein molybdopterin-binding subunit [Fulvimarina endophytica]